MIIDQNQHEWFWGEILAVENPLDEAWTSTKFAPLVLMKIEFVLVNRVLIFFFFPRDGTNDLFFWELT